MTQNKQWRVKTGEPMETGWYYAQHDWPNAPIVPRYVRCYKNGKRSINGRCYTRLTDFSWFGPVPEIEEVPCNTSSS